MLNIILPAVAPSSGTSDLGVLEADCPPAEADVVFLFRPPPKALGPRALCGGASSAWFTSVGNWLLSSPLSSLPWPEARSELSELEGFSPPDDPALPLLRVASAAILTGERCRGSWPHRCLFPNCLRKAPPHLHLFLLHQPSTSSSSCHVASQGPGHRVAGRFQSSLHIQPFQPTGIGGSTGQIKLNLTFVLFCFFIPLFSSFSQIYLNWLTLLQYPEENSLNLRLPFFGGF